VTAWPQVACVVGPTASGKSAVAMALAERIGGEIVNADAYQVYRGMDIGTAKATPAERAHIRHHLIDILEVTQELSVAQYQRLGRAVLAELADRDVPAVVAGGSGLYVRALLDDLVFPGSDPVIRAHWEAELEAIGAPALHAVLAERDPQAAAHILPTNGRRIVRALEVGQMTGAGFQAQLPVDGPALVPHLSIGLDLERPLLDARIGARTERMFADGFVEEVRGLLGGGLREGRTASRALGYPQVIDLLDGRISPAEAREAIVAATRAYARRQQRWFRRDPRTMWLDATAPVDHLAAQIEDRLAAPSRRLGP
jgi:tRNA dimethylallyltransferase